MGYYLNNEEAYIMYREVAQGSFFVDKSAMLNDIMPLIGSPEKYICITRPHRFGKTVMANMVGAFFSKAYNASDVFDSLDISKHSQYQKQLNQYNVVYIDFSDIDDECKI